MPDRVHFRDRADAGRHLADALRVHAEARPLIVLGLPRGGVPVAAEVARELDAPLDVLVVRKLGLPGQEELAMGAIASGGARVFNRDVIDAFRVAPGELELVIARQERELERREVVYRGQRRFPKLVGMTVILVDDGAATGASMRAAVEAVRELQPRSIIAAVPVASREAALMLREVADACVTVSTPEPFYGVGAWYRDFSETSDHEVKALLTEARNRWDSRPRPAIRAS